MWSQSRLGANFANGKRLPPWSLTRAMWVSTRAWARMSRSDSGAAALLSVQCPQYRYSESNRDRFAPGWRGSRLMTNRRPLGHL